MSNILTISPSPHLHNGETVNKIMYRVIIALIPALIWSFLVFGLSAIVLSAISVLTCVGTEFLIQKYMLKTKPTITDGSAVITGLLLAMNLPSNLPIWIVIIGAIVSIGIAKMSFGGLGNNPFNPALVGRVFLLISFPVQMTSWPVNVYSKIDATTAATPLGILKEGVKSGKSITELTDQLPKLSDLFIGNIGGSLGEISAVLLLFGMIYMLWKKVITWHIPVSILSTIFIFAGAMWLINPEMYINPMFQILSGGIMLGAIFMATDMATSPMSIKGQIIYGVGIGVITICIRLWGAYPEGISFAILIMNAFTPLINNYIKPKRFGRA